MWLAVCIGVMYVWHLVSKEAGKKYPFSSLLHTKHLCFWNCTAHIWAVSFLLSWLGVTFMTRAKGTACFDGAFVNHTFSPTAQQAQREARCCGTSFLLHLSLRYCRNVVEEVTYLRAGGGQELYSALLHPSSAPSPETILLSYLGLR